MRKPLVAGNWKMHKTIPEAVDLAKKIKEGIAGILDREALICPPFTAITAVCETVKGSNVVVGAQNVYFEEKGAFTGEIAPNMLADAGCKYVIIGHSERRQYFGETDDSVNKKMKMVFKYNMIPIVCVGEKLSERESGTTFEVIEKQIKNGIQGLMRDQAIKLVIAYEPVWAIGTGKTATPEQAEEVHAHIRKFYTAIYGQDIAVDVRILYGGSVKPDNFAQIMGKPNIDGGLVGGAALDADSFIKLVRY
jgi:triosephosphate isomerase